MANVQARENLSAVQLLSHEHTPSPLSGGAKPIEGTAALVMEEPLGVFAPEAHGSDDSTLLLGHHLTDFWMAMCVCHNLITEDGENGAPSVYQVSAQTL